MAHQPQAADAAARVAAEIDDQPRAREIGNRPAHVARDVHAQHAGNMLTRK